MFEVTIYQKTNSRGIKNSPSGFTTEFTVKQGDTETLSQAVSFDNCPAKYQNGYRKGDNFIKADCILADAGCDCNDNSAHCSECPLGCVFQCLKKTHLLFLLSGRIRMFVWLVNHIGITPFKALGA